MDVWLPFGQVFVVQPPYYKRATKRVIEEVKGFGERFIPTLRSEHTVVNLLAPPDDDEAMTQPQVVQLFWNTLAFELFFTAILFQGDSSTPDDASQDLRAGPEALAAEQEAMEEGETEGGGGGGGVSASSFAISPVTALTQGVVASAAAIIVILISAYAFRMGNSRQRPPPGTGWKTQMAALAKNLKRRWKRFRKRGCPLTRSSLATTRRLRWSCRGSWRTASRLRSSSRRKSFCSRARRACSTRTRAADAA